MTPHYIDLRYVRAAIKHPVTWAALGSPVRYVGGWLKCRPRGWNMKLDRAS